MKGSVDEKLIENLAELDPARRVADDRHPFRSELFSEDARGGSSSGGTAKRRFVASSLAVLALIGGLAVTPVGAAVSDVAGNFAGFLKGDGSDQLPGEPIPGDALPRQMRGLGTSDRRLLAERGEWMLIAAREGESLSFSFEGGAMVGSRDSWSERLHVEPVYLLAAHPAENASSPRPLFGIVAAEVASVKAIYADGSTSRPADASGGGFILSLDPSRAVKRVVAYDRDSQRVGSVDPGTFAGR